MSVFLAGTPALATLEALMNSPAASARHAAEGFVDALAMLVPAVTCADRLGDDTRADLVRSYGPTLPVVKALLVRATRPG
jgi:hypothetical protein